MNRGQPFNIGFATGHGGYIWATLIHADDIGELGSADLTRYLFEAPPEAKMRYRGKFWEKYHMAGGRYREAQYYSSRGMTHVASVDGVSQDFGAQEVTVQSLNYPRLSNQRVLVRNGAGAEGHEAWWASCNTPFSAVVGCSPTSAAWRCHLPNLFGQRLLITNTG